MKNYCENCKYKQLLHVPDINGEVFTKCNICLKSLECVYQTRGIKLLGGSPIRLLGIPP